MNTDKPTPAPEPGEPAEPTVALTLPGDAADPTVTLPASETSPSAEPTIDLSAPSPAAKTTTGVDESDPTAAGTAAEESDETVVLSPAEPRPTPDDADTTVTLSAAEESEPTTVLPTPGNAAPLPATEVVAPTAEDDDSTAVIAPNTEEDATAVVAPTSAEEADETVSLSAGELSAAVAAVDEDEETATLSAGAVAAAMAAAEESEATTVITAGAEPTIVVPKPRVSPEAKATTPVVPVTEAEPTVALRIPSKPVPAPRPASDQTVAQPAADSTVALPPVTRPEADSTVALPPVTRPEADSTVALPSVPSQRPAPTVTPPPAEPTVALTIAPAAPPVVPPREKPLTRRRLLWAIPALAGTALAGGTIAALAGRDEPKAATKPNLIVSEPPPAQSPTPAPTTPRPTAQVMKVPVHTLADFRKVVPGDAFPTDSIALTIDDGPHPEWTPQILRLLEKYHVPALFCMIGNQVLGHEPTAKDVVNDGHHIANHTWSHPLNVAELSAGKALKEIHRAQDKIYSTTGFAPSLFRAPGGAWSDGLAKSVSKSGVIPMDWTTDPRDWSRPGVAHITKRLMAAKPGQILLCHDGGGDRSQTVASLKKVIPALQAKGLTFVALA